VAVTEDLLANAQDHGPVATDQDGKGYLGFFVTLGGESGQELPVAHPRGNCHIQKLSRCIQDRFSLPARHGFDLPRAMCLSVILLGDQGRILSFF
jgi:hypothetical protein